ncbi:hypothetical protein LCI18_013947 [Fusarium solani-melongenae]|uniref:Uncharacterized protein n=1 Tax=Fusarium solani subsp. cucurbitae TaxID=2747967 RepID=A0ACD3ZPH1_FUSSC|nr:hypothetical protein LCI18_013947 [Fusarium solani-melongenae]
MASTDMERSSQRASLPRHIGPHILPDFPTFHRLLYLARVQQNRIAIHDVSAGIKATHAQYLSDILRLRNTLQARLDPAIQQKLLRGKEVYICLLARGGYEFAVGLFAIVALGAIAVPVSATATVKEGAYFRRTAEACAILTTSECSQVGRELSAVVRAREDPKFFDLPIVDGLGQPLIPLKDILISSDHELPLSDPGLVIFTSGTTGPPKGALKKRSFYMNNSETFAHWWRLNENDVVLHVLPVHHSTGLSVTFLAPIISGGCVEFGAKARFSAANMWERWLQGGLTVFSGVPTMYQRMMRYYEDEIVAKRGSQEAQKYAKAAQAFQLLLCGTSALPFSLQSKWIKLLGGERRILERYGGTEFSGVFSVQPGDMNNPDGSVGKVLPGVEVKLTDGEEGEIYSKSPHMFTRYLQNPKATAESFTPDGWFKSGDIARREGEYYFILGRASIDIIKSGGYKLSALDIEREILGLDYVVEAIVVGTDDEEYGQKVAVAIVPRQKDLKEPLTIGKLRNDLRARLSPYKMPQLLRLVNDFPRTPTGKVVKKQVRQKLFPPEGHPEVQVYKRTSKL